MCYLDRPADSSSGDEYDTQQNVAWEEYNLRRELAILNGEDNVYRPTRTTHIILESWIDWLIIRTERRTGHATQSVF